MSQQLQYDEAFSKKIEQIYLTPDVIEQRDAALSIIELQAGEKVLDVGAGPGMTTHDIAECVGESGSVIGTDISDNVLALAHRRCADQSWVSFEKCDATDLLFDDESFDAAVSIQVYEYVEDIDTALSELFRVLRRGGRAVILDSDWDSCVWHTRNRDRMHRIIDLWNTHCPKPFLPRTLKQDLERAEFVVRKRAVHTIFNPDYDENTYSYGIIDFMQSYIKGMDNVSHTEVDAWAEELHQLGKKGEYFFSLNRYIFVVEKPV